MMNQFEDMRMLIETIDRHGFSAAARRLGVSTQLVSRRIMALEERLGVQLLTRTTRRLAPTELGSGYVERARRILAEVEEAELALSTHLVEPRGTLRLSAPLSFGLSHLSSIIVDFLTLHPKVEIDLDLTDRRVDLVAEGFDMAVRIGFLPDSTLVARKLMDVGVTVVASPDYLRRRGIPRTVADLRAHDCLLFRNSRGLSWLFRVEGKDEIVPMTGALRASNGDVLRDAAIAGLGLSQLPLFLTQPAIDDGRLMSVLDDLLPCPGAVYAVHPAHRQGATTVRAFTDFLVAAFS